MIRFLLYLFESGLCLTILFLVYILFLRKETFFKFNRAYLVSIMILSLLVPFLHIHINITDTHRYENAINEIGKFKTYYEQLIAMTDPDYLKPAYPYNESGFEEAYFLSEENQSEFNTPNQISTTPELISNNRDNKNLNLSTAQIIFILYLLGVVFFLSRIVVLFHWIFKTISGNKVERYDHVKIIKLNQNLPPFSFLGYVFLNKDVYSSKKAHQILEHERAHIRQFHSIDLLIAHAITMIQWFNPFVWFLHKSIKTNHEYLADSKVVNKGYNLLDYQELLLSQFITIPSVQLVNNFNLISIKNRIKMMNKTQSGFLAKFKALLIIPVAFFAFILFANLTLKSPGKVLTNLSIFDIQNNINQVKGMWINTSDATYGKTLLFENSKFSVLDEYIALKEYPYQLQDNQIILSLPNREAIDVKYEVKDHKLKIWWSDSEYSLYKKSEHNNTLDHYLSDIDAKIDVPFIENYKLLQRLELIIDVAMVDDQIYVNKKSIDYDELKETLLHEKSKINQLDQNLITIRIFADKDLSMEYMHTLHQTLRELDLLKVAHAGKAKDPKVSKLQSGYIAMPKMLPPLEVEIADKSELESQGFSVLSIDATKEENTPESFHAKLKGVVTSSDKYLTDLYYDKTTPFNKYLGFHDMARSVIYEFRENYSQENYQLDYADLSSLQQKEIKKKFPLIISEAGAFKKE